MKIPLSLIRSFIEIDASAASIAETLTLLGLEVDRILNEHPSFAGVVVGEIISTSPHPNASKLTITQVSDGSCIHQVVCGAGNCRPGIKTAFALPGALLGMNSSGQIKIEKAVLRGIDSHGMLCSAEELGLASQTNGIIELPTEVPTGENAIKILWDPVFEISLTPNLGHCMSALGIARELSAALNIPLKSPRESTPRYSSSPEKPLKISSQDHSACPRYTGRVIREICVKPSPFWLQQTLLNCQIAPICNVVDAANYVMLAIGQPFHVFDLDKINHKELKIEKLETSKNFTGLDGIEREVPPGSICIFEEDSILALAGILGGKLTAVDNETKNIWIEAAVFDQQTIRKTTKTLDLKTESAQRFEKGIDPNGVTEALDTVSKLIADLSGGVSAAEFLDSKKRVFAPKQISCRTEKVNRLLGTRLSTGEIREIFTRLGFTTTGEETSTLQVAVPLRRWDVSEEIDLIEEVARIYGYNHIERPTPLCRNSQIPDDPVYIFEQQVRKKLAGFGMQEFLNSDLINKKHADQALEWIRPGASLLKAIHAKTEEYSVLRPSLLPGILQTIKRNVNFKQSTIAGFEIGRIHFLQDEVLLEEPMAALVLTGKSEPSHWSCKNRESDFFDLKGHIENLLEALNHSGAVFTPSSHPTFHPGRQADICFGDKRVGSLGEIHPNLLESSDLKQRIVYAEINIRLLMEESRTKAKMKPLAQYPASERDLTLSISTNTPIQKVFDRVRKFSSHLLEKAELIDLYVPEDKHLKNATFRFTYRDPVKTISFEETEAAHSKIVANLEDLK